MPMKFGRALPVIFWLSPDRMLDSYYDSVHPLEISNVGLI
jgi:hypothetical protein